MSQHLIEAMRQALEALEYEASRGNDDAYRIEREALRTAIAEAEKSNIKQVIHLYDEPPAAQQEPWEQFYPDMGKPMTCNGMPAYEGPLSAAQRQWVGLTHDEMDAIYEQHHNQYGECESPNFGYERAIEAKLKEKNT